MQGRAPEQVSGALVTANFFQVIGLKPQIGRVFTQGEDRVGGPSLAVISDQLWQRVFARDPKILGRSLNFAGELYTVVGVMPPQMFSPRTVEVWFPLMRASASKSWQTRDNHPGLFSWGRLKDGVTVEQAQADMSMIAARLEKVYPKSNGKVGVKVTELIENQVGEYRQSLRLLFGAVAVVLLIGCANLANLLAARGAARSREFAIRIAIGASRWQIVRQLLVESLVLAIAAVCWAFVSPPGAAICSSHSRRTIRNVSRKHDSMAGCCFLPVARGRDERALRTLAGLERFARQCADGAESRRAWQFGCARSAAFARGAHRRGGRAYSHPAQRRRLGFPKLSKGDFALVRL